jgi:hypothetical protein
LSKADLKERAAAQRCGAVIGVGTVAGLALLVIFLLVDPLDLPLLSAIYGMLMVIGGPPLGFAFGAVCGTVVWQVHSPAKRGKDIPPRGPY